MNRKTITFFATIFFALTLTLFSYATTKTQDGLQIELTTDKSSYTSSDTISVTVKVTNTGTTAVSDLTLENTIPTGYTKTTNTSSTKSVSILLAGDEAMLTTSFAKERSASDTTSGNGNATGNTSGGMGSGSSDTGGSSNGSSSGSSGTGGNSNSSSSGSNSSSNARGTTNTTDDVTATNASDSSQPSDGNGVGDTTRGEGRTNAISVGDTTGDEISGINGDSPTSDVGDDNGEGTSANEGDNDESGAISQNENAYEDESSSVGVEGSDIDGSSTGDGGVSPVAIAVGVIAVVGIAVAIVKIKSGKKLLSILICVSVVSVFDGEMMLVVEAAEYKTIEVSKSIKIGSETVKVVGSVKYQVGGDEEELGEPLPMPESATEYELEFWEKCTVYKVLNMSDSNEAYSESEIINLLKKRGFTNISIKSYYSMDGEFLTETSVAEESITKHPEYIASYRNKNGDIWTIYIVNNYIYANLLSYSIENPDKPAIFISETNYVVEYLSSNNYYLMIPKPNIGSLSKVDRIDAETLDGLTAEGLLKQ